MPYLRVETPADTAQLFFVKERCHSPLAPVNSAFRHFTRTEWAALAESAPLPLTSYDIERISGLDDPLDLREVDAIYRPVSALLQVDVDANRRLGRDRHYFFHDDEHISTPFIIGIAGSVAVGKSSTARLMRELLSRWPYTPRVQLITTDGFLYPNAVLRERGIMDRKGFPESYDRARLLDFMAAVKSGADRVEAPVYSHLTYDIVPGQVEVVTRPDVLIVEGLNVLQPARAVAGSTIGAVTVSDYFDFSIYVDADPAIIEQWYVNRFLTLRQTAFTDPQSYFRNYAELSDEEAVTRARTIWRTINYPNLVNNIAPTRERASLIIRKGHEHRVTDLYLRKI